MPPTINKGKIMKRFEIKTPSKTAAEFTKVFSGVRFSVLTPCLLRVESGSFCDEPTQRVWGRAFDTPAYKCEQKGAEVHIITDMAHFTYNLRSKRMKRIILKDGRNVKNFKKGNLKGTRRTLDGCNGAAPLEDGLISRGGVSVMDDSDGLILRGDKIVSRPPCEDKYYFAYGSEYRTCIADFFKLCGQVPLLPRYALGNWWSRYKAYTQEEYLTLMRRFKREGLPFTVATIDMDWHWVDVVKRFGPEAKPGKSLSALDLFYNTTWPGWTGYSWNTELFPDHKAMLRELKGMNYAVTLNLHPAMGVRFFEDMYEKVAARVGVDPSTKQQIPFSLANEKIVQAYFDDVLRPYEKEGVDFWWIDWQQGKNSDVPGLDPLWALNHYHFLDQKDEGKRALILSRYAKEGSHRYPVGFSGDTFMTWASLKFQPYMTATAANVGYTWWSHDIGGHHFGYKDDELYVRWLQFGVFSPINRLHSTSNEFMGKEPWKCSPQAEAIADTMLRLRHRLIPYLYSENYVTHTMGRALCEPMYYSCDCEEAYAAKGEYMFGANLLVCPIVEKTNKVTALASAKVWIPQGRWTDIFTGNAYTEGTYTMYRDLTKLPVFAREGAIIPMYKNDRDNNISMQNDLEVWIYRGNGEYLLYEDDGISMDYENGAFVRTHMSVTLSGDEAVFTIMPAGGEEKMLPKGRKTYLRFRDIAMADVDVDGQDMGKLNEEICVEYVGIPVIVTLKNCVFTCNADYRESVTDVVSRYNMKNFRKQQLFSGALESLTSKICAPKALRGPIEELRKICTVTAKA